MKRPISLKAGDVVRIVAPAGKIIPHDLDMAIEILSSWGLQSEIGQHIFKAENMFSAPDAKRLADLQNALDDNNVRAIFCARGGYGTNRIIDELDFTAFIENPKWIIGYSDITVLHSHIQKNYGIESVHGIMPKNIDGKESPESLESLKNVLFGEKLDYDISSHALDIKGSATATLIGGNLSILAGLTGTPSEPDYQDKILFIEEIGEYQYHVDRMIIALKRAGKLKGLKGLIVGHMTDISDPDPGIGISIEEMILGAVAEYGYPVAFGFPAGHQNDNRALILGSPMQLNITKENTSLQFIDEERDNQPKFEIHKFLAPAVMIVVFFVVIWLLYSLLLKKYLA